MAGGRGFGTKAEVLALQVGQCINRFIGGNEDGLEFLVFFALYQRGNLAAAAYIRLHKGKAAKPDYVQLVIDQAFYRCRVISDRCELHLHAEFLFEIIT
ncbi:hypothetical protein D3C81_1542850 [compost metagenome]